LTAALLALATGTQAAIVYDFDDGTLQGWNNRVWDGVAWIDLAPDATTWAGTLQPESANNGLFNTWSEWELWVHSGGDYDAHLNTQWLRSPQFHLNGLGDLTVKLARGAPTDPAPASDASVPYEAYGDGWNGLALRRVSDGAFVLSLSAPGGDLTTLTLTAAELSPYLSPTVAYTLDLVSIKNGGWGGIMMDDVSIPGVLVPPGPLDHFEVTATSPQTAGSPFIVTITAKDAGGRTVTTDSATVVTMTSSGNAQFDSDANGTFGDNTKTLSSGTFTIYTKDNVAESLTLTATAGDKNGDSSSITVNPAVTGPLYVDGLYEVIGSTIEGYTGIYVGETMPSTLNISNAAWLISSGTFYIGDNADGTVNLSGGTLDYTGGNFWIGWWGRGVMNISGGTANFNTSIIVYNNELNVSGGTLNVINSETRVGWDGPSFLSISGGTANLYSINMNHPLSTFSLTGGTLNLGAGGLFGNASSTIDFSGGTLKLNNNGAIAKDFDTDTVDALFFDEVPQATGTWGKTGSGAEHENDTYFTGSGVLTVQGTPGPLHHFDVTAASPQTAGSPFSVTVTAKDAEGRTVRTDSATLVTMTSNGSAQFDSDANGTFDDNTKTLASGTFTIYTKDNVAESVTLTATGGGKNGSSLPITVNSGTSPTPYQNWAGSHAFTDFNSEGVAYGMAWILGASTNALPSIDLLPKVMGASGGFFTLHFTRVLDMGPTAHLYVEYSDDLGGWTPVEVLVGDGQHTDPGSGIVFDVTTAGGLYDIQAHIPFGGTGKRFARLAATE
jgi:hypothetical protein